MAVERSGAEANVAARRFTDFFVDVVAVPLSVAQRNEDLEHNRSERRQIFYWNVPAHGHTSTERG
jgi:hypothetical protein